MLSVPAAVATTAWVFLFVVLLAAPPSGQRRRRAAAPAGPGSHDEPPAVVSLLAGRLKSCGFGATLIDLAARGWFRLTPPDPAGGIGTRGPGGPAMCVLPAELPADGLASYERRVVAHVALRAGNHGEVPAPALADGFDGGKAAFMEAFRDEVMADARERGLTRSRLGRGRIALLCLLAFVPAGTLLAASSGESRSGAAPYLAALCYCVLVSVTMGLGTSKCRTRAGMATLARWRMATSAAVMPSDDGRLEAYAAAIGKAPAALAVFAPAGKNVAWSGFGGSWHQVTIEESSASGLAAIAVLTGWVAILTAPVLFILGVIWLVDHGMTVLAWNLVGLVIVVAGTALGGWLARRALFPRLAEFDGQVLRQWIVTDPDGPDRHKVAIDDGARARAWVLDVEPEPFRLLTPGTFVHARLNARTRKVHSLEPVHPPAVPVQLADVAAEQQRTVTGGLPDPAALVTAHEAGSVLGRPVRGAHFGTSAGRTMTWRPTSVNRPSLRIYVRKGYPPAGTAARPVPGVADAYLQDNWAAVYVSPLTAVISIRGRVPAGTEASLIRILLLVAARLRAASSGG